MDVIRLPVQKLTREAFAPFGVLIDSRGTVEIDLGGGIPALTGATSERRPFRFDFMARHRLTMQVFSPLASSEAVICVAPPNERDAPDPARVVAFRVEGRLPYVYHKGTWHTPPFAVGEWYSYLVVDRAGTLEDDYELVDLKATRGCIFEIDI
ncbi:MAG TPA: ureidoglycolate lyase [Pyrinomonadaceae bacterium]|nr:ureidoglycolate lyase [Pyrinomonadaceae bacterium]